MATRNLLVKDFKLVRQPGVTVTYPVTVPDPPPPGDSQGAVSFGNSTLPEGGSITTADCVALGGIPFEGFCTLSATYSTGSGFSSTSIKRYRIVD